MMQMLIASIRWFIRAFIDGTQGQSKSMGISFLLIGLAIGGHLGYAQSSPCSISVSSTLSPAKYLTPVTVTASLSGYPAVNNVTGSVTLDGSTLCSLSPGPSSCSATFNSLTPGAHTIAWSCTSTGAGGSGQNSGSQQLQVNATRNFQMIIWDVADANVGLDSDIAFFIPFGSDDTNQPARHSILHPLVDSWLGSPQHPLARDQVVPTWNALMAQYHFSRIEAVLIDEPYWDAIGIALPSHNNDQSNPCLL